jgi:Alpha/beta hydrolase family
MTEEASDSAQVPEEKELWAFETEFLRAHGPLPIPATCPIGWQPGALTPVFYGFRDYDQARGAPGKVRVFFPSLDGSPQNAEILQGCGRYPVVLFAHGSCPQDVDHYLRWFQLPAQLARGGYVVVVPNLDGISPPPDDQVTQDMLTNTLAWIRQGWEFAQALLPPPATGLAGHSFGALHVGFLATKMYVAGVAYLSGVWTEWTEPGPLPIFQLQIPQLFTWGTGQDETDTATLSDAAWNAIAKPKHRAVFTDGWHFDYLYAPKLPCRGDNERGPCQLLGAAAADLVTMFFANYLPPELWPNLPDLVPDTLIPPPLNLTTFEQQFYAGLYLTGMSWFNADQQCSVEITHELATDRAVPYVLYTPRNLAAQVVQQRDLVPAFIETTGPGVQWISSQSPAPGTTVPIGSQVRMRLRTGPLPPILT